MRVKASIPYWVRAWICEKHGGDMLAEVCARLPPGEFARDLFRGTITRSGWISFDDYERLLLVCAQHVGQGDMGLIDELASFVADRDLRSIYKTFIRFSSTSFFFSKASLVWRMYYSDGRIEVSKLNDHACLVELAGFARESEVLCRAISNFGKTAIRMTRAALIADEHPACRLRGDTSECFSFRWC